jgi:predicted house-cleaning noncanonical NTP pyrophosphatase (MazG superfamily)
MPVYNKLVRDRIPEIIRESGKESACTTLDQEGYIAELKKKLQ